MTKETSPHSAGEAGAERIDANAVMRAFKTYSKAVDFDGGVSGLLRAKCSSGLRAVLEEYAASALASAPKPAALLARDAFQQERRQIVPDGWKLVPKEATQAMLDVFGDMGAHGINMDELWNAMLDAAPEPSHDD